MWNRMKQCMKNKTGFFNYYYFCCCSILWKIWRLEGKKWRLIFWKKDLKFSQSCVCECANLILVYKKRIFYITWNECEVFFLFFLACTKKTQRCLFFLLWFFFANFLDATFCFFKFFPPEFLESFDVKILKANWFFGLN
jgi:hypothetical protein